MECFGEAVYDGRPYPSVCAGKSFALKSVAGKYLYLFIYDLGIRGDSNVTPDGEFSGNLAFGNINDIVKSVEWMDNGESLDFVQKNDMLCVNFTGYEYGKSLIVRVAKAEIE